MITSSNFEILNLRIVQLLNIMLLYTNQIISTKITDCYFWKLFIPIIFIYMIKEAEISTKCVLLNLVWWKKCRSVACAIFYLIENVWQEVNLSPNRKRIEMSENRIFRCEHLWDVGRIKEAKNPEVLHFALPHTLEIVHL